MQHTRTTYLSHFSGWNFLLFLGYKHELTINVHVHAKILSSRIAWLIEVGRGKNKVIHWEEIEDTRRLTEVITIQHNKITNLFYILCHLPKFFGVNMSIVQFLNM